MATWGLPNTTHNYRYLINTQSMTTPASSFATHTRSSYLVPNFVSLLTLSRPTRCFTSHKLLVSLNTVITSPIYFSPTFFPTHLVYTYLTVVLFCALS